MDPTGQTYLDPIVHARSDCDNFVALKSGVLRCGREMLRFQSMSHQCLLDWFWKWVSWSLFGPIFKTYITVRKILEHYGICNCPQDAKQVASSPWRGPSGLVWRTCWPQWWCVVFCICRGFLWWLGTSARAQRIHSGPGDDTLMKRCNDFVAFLSLLFWLLVIWPKHDLRSRSKFPESWGHLNCPMALMAQAIKSNRDAWPHAPETSWTIFLKGVPLWIDGLIYISAQEWTYGYIDKYIFWSKA